MLLALSVISANAANLGPTAYKVFESGGGSIGRLESNDWTLPDPDKFVSSRHAVLGCDGDGFYLEDVSTNGTFINAQDRRVAPNQRVPLKDGDRIFIGDYEILVQLIDDSPAAPAQEPAPAPQGLDQLLATPAAPAPPPLAQPDIVPVAAHENVDPLAVLVGGYSPPPPQPPPAPKPYPAPPATPQAAPASSSIPMDWRTVLPAAPRASPAPAAPVPAAFAPQSAFTPPAAPPPPSAAALRPGVPPAPQAAAPAAAAGPVAGSALDLLTALGLDPARVSPAIGEQLGLIMRIVVQGMIEVLQSRADVKNNFRMPMTSIRPVENNPLKFSLNADDALHNLFIKHNPGYLGAVESFQEGFQDIAYHQMAMVAGIRAAFNAMMAKLNPEHLEDIYERKLRRTSMINLGNRMKFWEMYRAQFEEYDKDREAGFQLLFGEEFAKAYHEQLQRLAAAGRARSR